MEYKEKMSIKEWAVEDRPREKLLSNGIVTLSDAELIAILIGSGNRDESAVELSRKLLASCKNDLNELGRLSIHDLCKLKGIGKAKAISIVAALELGKRRKVNGSIANPVIKSSKDAFEIFHPMLCDKVAEDFWILLLNRGNKIMEKQCVSQGGTHGTVVDVKIIIKHALDKYASGIILCHNHPSGNPKPSPQDHDVTKKISEAAKLLEISVLDHIIIGGDTYYSFADEGNL